MTEPEQTAQLAGETWDVRQFEIPNYNYTRGIQDDFIEAWANAHINSWIDDLNTRNAFQPHMLLLVDAGDGVCIQLAHPLLKYLNGGPKGIDLFMQTVIVALAESKAFALVWSLPTFAPESEEALRDFQEAAKQGAQIDPREAEGFSEVIVISTENYKEHSVRVFPVDRDDEGKATAPVEVNVDDYFIKMPPLIKTAERAMAEAKKRGLLK